MSKISTISRAAAHAPLRGARIIEFFFRRRDAAGDLFPDDAASGTVGGSDSDRVLFVGERGELSLGVRTHELSLPAFFSRHRAARTTGGVTWSIESVPSSRIQDLPDVIRAQSEYLPGCSLVVVQIGITDALRVVTSRAWERHLHDTIDALIQGLPRRAQIVIGEIPPLDNAGSLSKPARIAAGLHGRLLNQRTQMVARRYDTVTVVAFPDLLTQSVWRPESEETRYRETYKVWGEHLSTEVLPKKHTRES